MSKGLAFIFGAIVSGVSTYFITKKVMEERYFRKLDEAVRTELDKMEEEKNMPATVESEEDTKQYEAPEKKIEVVDIKDKIPEPINTSVVDYRKMAGQYGEEEEMKDNWVEEKTEPVRDESGPYLITEEEHETTAYSYNAETYVYNPVAQELYNDVTGETVDSPEIGVMFGMKNFTDFVHGDEDEIWIRNDSHATDYNLVKDFDV